MNKPPQLYRHTAKGDLSRLLADHVPTLKIRFGRDNAGNEWAGDEIVAAHVLDKGRDGGHVWVSINIPDVSPPAVLKQWVSRPTGAPTLYDGDGNEIAPRDIDGTVIAVWPTTGGMFQYHVPAGESIPQPPARYGPIKCYMPDERVQLDNQAIVSRVVSVDRVVCSIRPVGPYHELPTDGGAA
jgi:hypothetical protein